MTRPHALVLFSLVVSFSALSACSGATPLTTPDAPPDSAPPPGSMVYALQSQLDLAGDLPGAAGSAVDELIAATDDPDDPTRFVVDRIIADMDDGALKSVAEAAEPFATAYVNERLLARSPALLGQLVAIGHAFGEAAHQLGTMDTLEISPDGGATHAVVGVRVDLDGQVSELGFADAGLPSPSAAVALGRTGQVVSLGTHTLSLSLGGVLRLVIDGAIVPHVVPGKTDLVGVLTAGIDCAAFGADLASALGFGAPDGYAAACSDALTDLAGSFYAKLAAVDGAALQLQLSGSAQVLDTDGDGVFDQLVGGAWTGTVSYAGLPAPLPGGTFSGARVTP